MTTTECGEAHLLVQVADLDHVMDLYTALRHQPFEGLIDLVPAANTLLIEYDHTVTTGSAVRSALSLATRGSHQERPTDRVVVDVVYGGGDLDEVTEMFGMDHEQVVAWHTSQVWTVAFSGFSPGFAYMVGDGARQPVPRLADPRTKVPAGAVGLAGEFTGIYPRPSPGGWRIIGRTDETLWDIDRNPPALLRPGVTVTFRAS